jgi:transglutaminase-like putative cysteine protease
MVTLFMAYVLVITNLLYSNALPMLLYMLVSVTTTTTVLIRIHHPAGMLKDHMQLTGRLLIQAIPITAVLFVFFPRVQGALWRLPTTATGQTGFSEQLRPGSISQLVQSRDVAFRAQLSEAQPAPGQLYWRGIVLTLFDGNTWHPSQIPAAAAAFRAPVEPVTQWITLEPHQRQWMFALEVPFEAPAGTDIREDFTLRQPEVVKERMRYRVRSDLNARRAALTYRDAESLMLPEVGNPRARALAGRWRQTAETPEAIVHRALAFFKDNDFVYTLNPPLLGDDGIDAFLFETRRGYCEHYASATAFLMRAAGVPARIVVGYLGGERNPYGDYLIVRQFDAHAWIEVWLDSAGWKRFDPTAAVAPRRAADGITGALSPEELAAVAALPRRGRWPAAVYRLQLAWDAVNTVWNKHVMGYNAERQRRLLSRLGWAADSLIDVVAGFGIGLLAVVLMTVGFSRQRLRKDRRGQDPVQRSYLKFCRKMNRCGVVRPPGQGPVDYLSAISRLRPDLSDSAGEIIGVYIRLRYSGHADAAEAKTFQTRVRKFHPSGAVVKG